MFDNSSNMIRIFASRSILFLGDYGPRSISLLIFWTIEDVENFHCEDKWVKKSVNVGRIVSMSVERIVANAGPMTMGVFLWFHAPMDGKHARNPILPFSMHQSRASVVMTAVLTAHRILEVSLL